MNYLILPTSARLSVEMAYPGSKAVTCVECGAICTVAPAGQVMIENGEVHPLCFECALAKGPPKTTELSAESRKELGNFFGLGRPLSEKEGEQATRAMERFLWGD